MDLMEIGRAIGRLEAKTDHFHGDMREFMAKQIAKNTTFEEISVYVNTTRARRKWIKRTVLWIAGLFIGSR